MKSLTPKELLEMLNERDDMFCHVSTRIFKDGYFEPRVPENIDMYNTDEDCEIDRICVSRSLEDALISIPQGAENLCSWFEDNGMYFKVFIIDTKELGIKRESIYTPKDLIEKEYVSDADITNEHWILESFNVPDTHSFLINISNDYKVSSYNNLIKFDKLNFYADYLEEGEIIDIDLSFIEEYYIEDVSLEDEKIKLKEIFKSMNPDIEFIDGEMDQKISILSKKSQSIREIMEYDSKYKSKLCLEYIF
jgi:hypothetical protein